MCEALKVEPGRPQIGLRSVVEGGVAEFDESADIHLAGPLGTVFPGQFVLEGRLIGLLDIEVADAALVGPGHHHAHHVGAHTRDILAAGKAVAEPSGIVVDEQLAADEVVVVVGIGQRPEQRQVPVGPPHGVGIVEAEGRTPVLAGRDPPHRAVMARIGAVHVAGHAAAEQCMVETRVELDACSLAAALDRNASQPLVPLGGGAAAHVIKVEPVGFGAEVGPGILHRGVGESDAELDPLVGRGPVAQGDTGPDTAELIPCKGRLAPAIELPRIGPAAQLGIEINSDGSPGLVFLGIKRFVDGIPLDMLRIGDTDKGIDHRAAFSDGVADVEEDVRGFGCGEDVALEPDAGGSRQFGADPVVLEQDRIIARLGVLVGLVEARAEPGIGILEASRHGLHLAHGGHQQHTAHLKLMQAGESLDRGVSVLVAHGLPAARTGIAAVGRGTQFGHAERFGRRRIEEPPAVDRPQVGVHVIGRSRCIRTGRRSAAGCG